MNYLSEIRLFYEWLGTHPLPPSAIALWHGLMYIDYFLEIRMLYPSYEEAYEVLEDYHEAITGRRKYSEYGSFRYAMKVKRR